MTPATLSRLPPVSPEIFPQRCSRERENDNKIAIETFYQRRLYKKNIHFSRHCKSCAKFVRTQVRVRVKLPPSREQLHVHRTVLQFQIGHAVTLAMLSRSSVLSVMLKSWLEYFLFFLRWGETQSRQFNNIGNSASAAYANTRTLGKGEQ